MDNEDQEDMVFIYRKAQVQFNKGPSLFTDSVILSQASLTAVLSRLRAADEDE